MGVQELDTYQSRIWAYYQLVLGSKSFVNEAESQNAN
jgi:hypothetical protein